MIVRLAEEPRAVELEIAAPLGMRTVAPFDDTLNAVGARTLGMVVFTTASRVVLRAKLVESNGQPLDPNRIGLVLEALRKRLTACTPGEARAA